MKYKFTAVIITLFMLFTAVFSFEMVKADEETDVLFSANYESGYRYNAQGYIYLHLEGEAYNRGYQHGYLLAAEIVDHINRWSNVIHNSPIYDGKYIPHDSAKYEKLSNTWWDFCRSRIEKIYWDRTPEEYQNEMEGIADGVKARGGMVHGREVDYVDILAINQMFEFMTRFETPNKGFHPLKDLFNKIKDFVPTSYNEESNFVKTFLEAEPASHCNAFIATGDATTHGQMVAAQSVRCGGWWYPYYVAQRWNVIIDIIPRNGNRFIMSSCPGYIWSDQNYYQNEEGIIILDTTLPQGLWKDSGYSMVIRTRNAIQYSNTLDEAIELLMEKNDGLWTAGYLIGDTETGEIARLDLGLYAYEIWRESDGFLISDNNAQSMAVRAEANGLGIKGALMRIMGLVTGSQVYSYFTLRYFDAPRGAKMKELGEECYGNIDIDVLKEKIMFEFPVCDSGSTDIKATDTNLINHNSLWVFWGRANGDIWDVSDQESNLKGVKPVPPMGWTYISGVPAEHEFKIPEVEPQEPLKNSRLSWKYDFAGDYEGRNQWYANLILNNDNIIASDLDGNIYILDSVTGKKLWDHKINDYGGLSLTWVNADDEYIYAGWENQTCAIDQKTKEKIWVNTDVRFISSKPVLTDDKVIFANRNGEIYALDKETGTTVWNSNFEVQKVYLSYDEKENNVIAGIGDKCYAIDASNGETIWCSDSKGLIVSPALVWENTIYYGNSNSSIFALNTKTGNIKWTKQTGWGVYSTPVISDDKVFVTSMDHHIYALDKNNGEMIWAFAGKAAIHSSPTVYGDYVFFGCDDGRFYAVNKENGKLVWDYAPALTIDDDIYNYITTAIVGNSVADDGKIFFSTNGEIYGFYAQTVEPEKVITEEESDITPGLFIALIIICIFTLFVAISYFYEKSKRK